jgi:hypothetical protein
MDLSGGRFETSQRTLPVLSGWVNAVYDDSREARGDVVLPRGHEITVLHELPTINVGGVKLTITLLQSSSGDHPQGQRFRFIAQCDPAVVRPRLKPNPRLTRTQEFFISEGLRERIEAETAAPAEAPVPAAAPGRVTARAATVQPRIQKIFGLKLR